MPVKDNTKIISITLYNRQLDALDKVVEAGYSNNRSLLIRKIIDNYIRDYVRIIRIFEILTPDQIKILGE